MSAKIASPDEAATSTILSRRSTFVVVAVVVISACVLYQLLVTPFVGMADNGDFGRTISQVGIEHLEEAYEDRYFANINEKYVIGRSKPQWTGYVTSEVLFIYLASVINGVIFTDGLFDLRSVGLVHAAFYIAGIAIMLVAMARARPLALIVFAVLTVLVFTDVGYVAYLNSFYGEPVSMIGFLFIVGLSVEAASRRRHPSWLIVGFYLSAMVLLSAKPSNSLLGFLLAAYGCWIFRASCAHRRGLILVILLAAATCIASVFYYRENGRNPVFAQIALYDMVFHEILGNSPSPGRDLLELGMQRQWSEFAGTHAFIPNGPFGNMALRRDLAENVSYPKIALFYARHPDRAINLASRGASSMFSVRSAVLGNFSRTSGFPPGTLASAFSFVDAARSQIPHTLWFLIAYCAVSTFIDGAIIWLTRDRGTRDLACVSMLCILTAISQFAICLLAEGEWDLARHLFLFNFAMDFTLIFNVLWIVGLIAYAISPTRSAMRQTGGTGLETRGSRMVPWRTGS